MNAQYNSPISDRVSSLCARVFSYRRHIGKREDPGDEVGIRLNSFLLSSLFSLVQILRGL